MRVRGEPTPVVPNPQRALILLSLAAVVAVGAALIGHGSCTAEVTGQVRLLTGALLAAGLLVETVRVPSGLDRVGRVRLMSGINAVLLPAAVLLPPGLFLVVGVGSVLPFLRTRGVVGALTEACVRAAQMSAAAVAFYWVDPGVAEVPEVGEWMSAESIVALIAAGLAMLVVESLLEALSLRVGEGLLPEDVPWLDGRGLVRDTPEVAIGALACVLMPVPAAIVLLVPLFLLENQMLRAHAAQLCGFRDGKTGLLTLTAFDELAQGEMSRARRTGQPVAVVMLDLDGLKTVNRTHGHLAGDRVVIALAQLLLRSCRQEDLVCRFGGDEFCLLLPGAGVDQAALVAERIRATAQGTEVSGLAPGARLSVSVGVAVAAVDDDITSLLGRADEGLLRAKGAGGNRVRVVEPAGA